MQHSRRATLTRIHHKPRPPTCLPRHLPRYLPRTCTMRLRPEQLQKQLTQTLAPVYHVSGDEMLLMMEACDVIRAAARQQGFDEREIFHVESHFDWGNVIAAGNTMSLFGSRKLIELRLNKPKPDE